jgi:hypothetical protein
MKNTNEIKNQIEYLLKQKKQLETVMNYCGKESAFAKEDFNAIKDIESRIEMLEWALQ